jgi:hypothetical protein
MPRAEFAKYTKIAHQPDAPRGSSECILGYFAASKEDVDAILKRANAAGGAVPGEAEDQPWGYSGYFTDPDGHLWEIMWKPALVGDATQANRKHGVVPEVGTISFMRVLPGPIERVWAYLTEHNGAPSGWTGGAAFPPCEPFSPQIEPTPERYKQYEGDDTSHGRVNRCEPPRLLSFMWGERVRRRLGGRYRAYSARRKRAPYADAPPPGRPGRPW